jgi:hypothetical protein
LNATLINLPLGFESGVNENEFFTRGQGYDLRLQATSLVLASSDASVPSTVSLRVLHGNAQAKGTAVDQLPGKTNYLIGNDRKRWRTNVGRFARVVYHEVYPGVDLIYYGNQQQLEYDFIVAPGKNSGVIHLGLSEKADVRVSNSGDLIAQTSFGELRQPKPVAYQEIEGKREEVAVRYVLYNPREFGFAVAPYDHSRPLIIDPTLVYSTYLGGSGDDSGSSIAADVYNNIYITGTTSSTTFPTKGPFASTNSGLSDMFVTKIDAGGTLVYSTYIGGAGLDRADGIAVDEFLDAFVVGRVDPNSSNFPTTTGAFAPTYRGGDFDAVVFKLNSAGNDFLYSTFLGGEENDSAVGVAVDDNGNAYVTGGTRSTGFPTTGTAYQPTKSGDTDGFLVKLDWPGATLLYATFLGGGGTDRISGVATDDDGNAYLDGYTASSDFPTQNAFQNVFGGGFDAFLAKIDTKLSGPNSLELCSYLGGAGDDKAYGIAATRSSNFSFYLVGQTSSSNFPVLNAAQPVSGGNFDAFVAKISPTGVKEYASYLGGSSDDRGTGITFNGLGEVYLTGFTSSVNFPAINAIQPASGGGTDAFVAKLNASGSSLLYSTYLGGGGLENSMSTATATNPITRDGYGNVYLTGYTTSTSFPTFAPLQAANAGGQDVFVAKIWDVAAASLQFSASNFSANEGDGSVKITVTRTANTDGIIDVDYATANGSASERTDYVATVGTLHFAAGESSKKFTILLRDDVYVEGSETVNLTLQSPRGGGALLGSVGAATLTIGDNDTAAPSSNPLDVPAFFVRQHYLDFLNREPDPDGLAYWTNEIAKCGSDTICVNNRRIDVSAAFFASDEFQLSGAFIYRFYRAAFGRPPTYAEFTAARSKVISRPNVVDGISVFLLDFMARPEFTNKYPPDLVGLFIKAFLLAVKENTGVDLSAAESHLNSEWFHCVTTVAWLDFCRARVVEEVIRYNVLVQALHNETFVTMEYFGYLKRDPDPDGYAFWLNVLNSREPNNYRGMVCSFITSAEYQQRFSPVVTRTNAECSGVH